MSRQPKFPMPIVLRARLIRARLCPRRPEFKKIARAIRAETGAEISAGTLRDWIQRGKRTCQ